MLSLYNTAKRCKQPLIPRNNDHVSMYVCGPTVYDHIHVGNARLMTVFDTLYRVLRKLYPRVSYVRNITDIDDKIIQAAHQQNITTENIVQKTTAWFHEAVDRLGLDRPSAEPKATEYIPHMIHMIQTLIHGNKAYAVDGHVMFDVSAFADYGQLSGMSLEQLHVGARIEPADYKRNPLDFILWKPALPQDPGWDSPWGRGRPGWHIECSAMSTQLLGDHIDIHGGGRDLLFPHHENERAQTCACTGQAECALLWVHVGMVTVDQQKMSKSLGNFITLANALDHHHPSVVRWALLSSHYRHPLSWGEDLLHQATCHVRTLQSALSIEAVTQTWHNTSDPELCPQIWDALCDDLNTPQALHSLHHLAVAVKNNPTSTELAQKLIATLRFFNLFSNDDITPSDADTDWILHHIDQRTRARQAKDFNRADAIRLELLKKGIVLKDSEKGTTWHRTSLLTLEKKSE